MVSKLNYYQGKIVVYFKEQGSIIRYKILKIDKKELDRSLHVKSHVFNSQNTNNVIDEIYNKVDSIISDAKSKNKLYLLNKEYIEFHLEILNKKLLLLEVNDFSEVTVVYEKFLKRKMVELLNKQGYQHIDENLSIDEIRYDKTIKDSTRSIKDYISTLNLIKDYQEYSGEIIKIKDLDKIFLSKLHTFASSDKDRKRFITRKQSDRTFRKRIDCLKEFFRYLENKYEFKFEQDRVDYTVNKGDSNIIVFEEKELKQLIEIEFSNSPNPNWEKIRDIMVFLCNTGMRYSDFTSIDFERDVNISGSVYTIIKNAIKTRNRFEVALNDRAVEIWKKYNFNFKPHFPSQVFNREVKDMLKHYNILTKEVLILKYYRGKEIKSNEKKHDHISSHTGRRTFITNCVKKNVPLHRIMAMTGHKKLDTLIIYFEKWGMKSTEYVDLINI